MNKFIGYIEIEHRFSQHLGPRFQSAGVTIDLSTADVYSFNSGVSWPEEDYAAAVERGVRDGLMESGIDPDKGVAIVLKGISYHEVDSSERAFYFAAKCAAKSKAEIDWSISQNQTSEPIRRSAPDGSR